MTLPIPKAVLFDWDDTIIDSWSVALQAVNTTLTSFGKTPWTDAEARGHSGPSARDMFMQHFGERWQEADKIYFETYKKLQAENIRLHTHVEDILRLLKENSVYMGVVSNKRGAQLRTEVSQLNFDHYFQSVVGAGDARADKPSAEPIFLALRESGIAPSKEVWFIGDSHTDMMCAHGAGCSALLIETKTPPEALLAACPPTKRFSHHSEIMKSIESLFRK